jgi:hypothetical protein
VISAIPPADTKESWQVSYVLADSGWSSAKMAPADGMVDEQGQPYVAIHLKNEKGFKATLRLYGSHWE